MNLFTKVTKSSLDNYISQSLRIIVFVIICVSIWGKLIEGQPGPPPPPPPTPPPGPTQPPDNPEPTPTVTPRPEPTPGQPPKPGTSSGNTIEHALDKNNNRKLDDAEIIIGIKYWIESVLISGVNQRISDSKMIEMINMWILGTILPPATNDDTGSPAGAFVCRTEFTGRELRVPGAFNTVQRAISAANDGDKILISPGLYQDKFTVNKSLILEADELGEEPAQIQVGDGESAIGIINTSDVVIRGLVVTGSRGGIRINRSENVCLEQNSISNNTETGISMVEAIDIRVENNLIKGNASFAISAFDSIEIDILNNEIIDTVPQGTVSSGTGFSAIKSSRINIEDNLISANRFQGISLSEVSDVLIRNNHISKLPDRPGSRAAIAIHMTNDTKGVEVVDNIISEVEIAIKLMSTNGIDIIRNRFSEMKVHGILIADSTRISLEDNDLSNVAPTSVFAENEAYGVLISQKSRVILERNRITDSLGFGVLIIDDAEAELTDNDIFNINGKPGSPGRGVGIDNSTATLSNNRIQDNEGDAIALMNESSADIGGNTITGNEGFGIWTDETNHQLTCSIANEMSFNELGNGSDTVPLEC